MSREDKLSAHSYRHTHTHRDPHTDRHIHTYTNGEWNTTWQWGNPRRELNTNTTSAIIISTLNWILSARTDWMPMRAKWTGRRFYRGHRGHRTYVGRPKRTITIFHILYLAAVCVCVYLCVFALQRECAKWMQFKWHCNMTLRHPGSSSNSRVYLYLYLHF